MKRFLLLLTATLVTACSDSTVSPASGERLDQAAAQAYLRTLFAEADTDGSGKLETAEVRAFARQAFEQTDDDGDAKLDATDEVGARAWPMGADSDGDGTLTQAEYESAALDAIGDIDIDGDGVELDEVLDTLTTTTSSTT